MKSLLSAAALAFVGLTAAPVVTPDSATAFAQNKDALRAKCKQMLKQQLGVEQGRSRRGRTGGGASTYYGQIDACIAKGGRL